MKISSFRRQLFICLSAVIITLGVSVAFQSILAAWTGPTATPPGGNVAEPINTGATSQTKIGGLTLNTSGSTNALIIQSGRVGLGYTSPRNSIGWASALDVNGEVGAARYYDDDRYYYIDSNSTSIINWAQIRGFHDLDNTGYYVDLNNTTRMNSLNADYVQVNGNIHVNNIVQAARYYDDDSNYYVDSNVDSRMNHVYAHNFSVYGGTYDSTGRTHVAAAENIYLLARAGTVFVSGAWGGGGRLYVDGNVEANDYYLRSDRTLKKDISPLNDSLTKINQLEGVSFKWKKDDKSDIGFIAQDVEKIFPELVNTNENGLKSIDYMGLIAPLTEAVKTQTKQIEDLQKTVEKQNEEINALQEKIAND